MMLRVLSLRIYHILLILKSKNVKFQGLLLRILYNFWLNMPILLMQKRCISIKYRLTCKLTNYLLKCIYFSWNCNNRCPLTCLPIFRLISRNLVILSGFPFWQYLPKYGFKYQSYGPFTHVTFDVSFFIKEHREYAEMCFLNWRLGPIVACYLLQSL